MVEEKSLGGVMTVALQFSFPALLSLRYDYITVPTQLRIAIVKSFLFLAENGV
jgi:hypothetical protein